MKKYTCIVVDPPYDFSDRLSMSDVKRGAKANYDTMSMQEIRDLPIKEICDPDGAVLCLWVPSSLLQDGLDIMKFWGFKQKQTYIWVKVKKSPILEKIGMKQIISHFKKLNNFNWTIAGSSIKKFIDEFSLNNILSFGMGRIFRQTHEICLIGTNSNKIYKKLQNKSQRSVSFGENLKHSAKPEHLQNSLDIMFPDNDFNKIEIFARRLRNGWKCLGNEVCDGEDIRVSLKKLR